MSRTWIFQTNPARFDIDGYLATSLNELPWLVTTNAKSIGLGDTVYLWRSGDDAGIIAETEIIEPVRTGPDDPGAMPFWRTAEDGARPAPRTRLRLRRVAGHRGVLRREWLKEDHELRSLTIIRQPNGTNYAVSPPHAARLAALWENTGTDWTYPEVVAALWAYARVWDQSISKAEGSLVDEVSRRINRVIPGVYNKLMNLRALDPRVDAKGLSGGSKVDRHVWEEFFDDTANSVRVEALNEAYERLWAETAVSTPMQTEGAAREALESEVRRLGRALKDKSLDELLALYITQNKTRQPRRRTATTTTFDRNPLVVLITKRRAAFKCEVTDCTAPVFVADDQHPYVETHHLVPLAEGGADSLDNTACLCAGHHREIHCGRDRVELANTLLARRALDRNAGYQ